MSQPISVQDTSNLDTLTLREMKKNHYLLIFINLRKFPKNWNSLIGAIHPHFFRKNESKTGKNMHLSRCTVKPQFFSEKRAFLPLHEPTFPEKFDDFPDSQMGTGTI